MSDHIAVAKHNHFCDFCGGLIPKGTKFRIIHDDFMPKLVYFEHLHCPPSKPEGDMEILDSIADKDPLANLKRLEDKKKLKVPGTRLLRAWKGRQHEVIIDTDGKFIYRGKRFRSLSAIARKITGVQWNGKQFFGVKS